MMLSTTFNIELTEMRFHTYWRALQPYPIEAVIWAGIEAAKDAEHFPVPLTLRSLAEHYHGRGQPSRHQRAKAELPERTATTDEEGIKAIREILRRLGGQMTMTHPVYCAPSPEDPTQRRARLLAQARKILEESAREEGRASGTE